MFWDQTPAATVWNLATDRLSYGTAGVPLSRSFYLCLVVLISALFHISFSLFRISLFFPCLISVSLCSVFFPSLLSFLFTCHSFTHSSYVHNCILFFYFNFSFFSLMLHSILSFSLPFYCFLFVLIPFLFTPSLYTILSLPCLLRSFLTFLSCFPFYGHISETSPNEFRSNSAALNIRDGH